MDEIALTTPTFMGVSFEQLDQVGSMQWPCNLEHPDGTPIMHEDEFTRGKGRFMETVYVPTTERSTRKYPLILTTGRILSQYNVGAQTRRTANVAWHPEDILELHPHDAEVRGIEDGDTVALSSRVGRTTLRAKLSDRMPVGVCYTTFHHPVTGRERDHHRELGLGDQLPGVQGHRGTGRSAGRASNDGRRTRGGAEPDEWKSHRTHGWPTRSPRQFEHKPPADAALAIANHIKAVWDPRMKRALVDRLEAGANGLDPVAALAAGQVRATLK